MLCTTNNSKYTNIKNLEKIAERNFKKHISLNFYPGRGIVVGKNRDNSWILIYWIMGRSSQSRNRIFKYEKGILFTESIGTNLYNDSNFVIYNAMRDLDEGIVVTNGSHTDKIYEGIRQGKSFLKSLESEKHESDSPNYTPRIACFLEKLESRLSMIKICKSDFTINYSSHHYYSNHYYSSCIRFNHYSCCTILKPPTSGDS